MIFNRYQNCVFYHWWRYPHETCTNIRTPILLSIATLRAVSDVPIVVLDASNKLNDWRHFPEKLKFQVIPIGCVLEKYKDLVEGWQYLSRIYDINLYSGMCETTIYSDSDVFWLRNPLPLNIDSDKFTFDGWNTGFFYYKTQNHKLWFDVFDSFTRASIHSEEVRSIMKKYVGYDGWYEIWDEMILSYMVHSQPYLFRLTDVNEHLTTRMLPNADKDKAKMFHCNGTMVKNPITNENHARGLMALLVDEFYQNVIKVMDKIDLEIIFGNQLIDYCNRNRFSLFKDQAKLMATKDEQGLFHTISMK